MVSLLQRIDVHVPFRVHSWWSNQELGESSLRGERLFQDATALTRYGANLANAWYALKNRQGKQHWEETMDYVQLGLGDVVADVTTRPSAGGGRIALEVKYKGIPEPVPDALLSDGTLAYLAFVALFRLNTGKSLVAVDEPETHLHPHLQLRLLDLCERMAEDRPVLLATHSDRLVDGVSDPARSVVLCELDSMRMATRLARPNRTALGSWLERYRGIGDLRAEGYERHVFDRGENK